MNSNTNLKIRWIISVVLVVLWTAVACGEVIYVDDDAPLAGNGQTWGTAYKYLQDALLADATSGDQVWVAAGTYKPDQDEGGNVTPGNRRKKFELINGVGIYGGFPSGGAWEDRDPNIYETILSGDIGIPNANNDNSYHVVTAMWTDETPVLEGFAITGGNANGSAFAEKWGGGMLNYSGNPTVTNCTFTGNEAGDFGGGMYNEWSSPTVTNCTFSGNEANFGGGMFNYDTSNPTVTNSSFSGNTANIDGGGMYNIITSDPTVTNCTFSGNSADKDGGGMYNVESNPTVTNCTFTNNTALGGSGGGGGMHNNRSNSAVTNCTFWDNTAHYGGGMCNSGSDPTVTNCTFWGNTANYGGGMRNSSSDPTVTNCTFSGNEAVWFGGGMYNVSGRPTVTNCILWGNSDSGGTDVSAQIHNVSSTPVINYCCVQGWTGGGTGNIDDDPNFVDPNGADNTAGTEDDNLRLLYSSPCIDAGDNSAVPADTADLDNDGNTIEPTPWDLDGRPRFADGDCNDSNIVDMGAYEFAWVYIGDFDGQCDVDFADFAIFALAWLTEQGDGQYNPDCDISLPADSYIDWRDVKILCDNWLAYAGPD